MYPPLALLANITGTVKLELTVDRASGAVRQARVLGGHPILREVSVDTAERWRFDPATINGDRVTVEVLFKPNCPKPLAE